MRKYSTNLDERLVKVRFINTVATGAVYNDKINTSFVEDISDSISNLNDNAARELNTSVYDNFGELVEDIDSLLLMSYEAKKQEKNQRLKNRKNKDKNNIKINKDIRHIEKK